MKRLIKSLKSKRGIIGCLSLVCLVGFSIYTNQLNSKINSLGLMAQGLQTCYLRTGQSFTAKLIGDTSSLYLDKKFLFQTEDCFAEEVSLFEDYFIESTSVLLKKINTLSSDIHWFHEKLKQSKNNFNETVTLSYLSERFSSTEDQKNSLADLLNEKISEQENSLQSSQSFLFVLYFLVPLLILWEFFAFYRKNQKFRTLDSSAYLELGKNDKDFESENVENLIEKTLLLNDMNHSIKLFNKYQKLMRKDFLNNENHQEVQKNSEQIEDLSLNGSLLQSHLCHELEAIYYQDDEETDALAGPQSLIDLQKQDISFDLRDSELISNDFTLDDFTAQKKNDDNSTHAQSVIFNHENVCDSLDEKIDKIWESDESRTYIEEQSGVNIEDLCLNVADIFKNKLFVKSISFRHNIAENVQFVDLDKEVLEQVFYQLTLSCIKSCESIENENERYIHVYTAEDRDASNQKIITINFKDPGSYLDESLPEIMIARHLLEESDVKLNLELVRDEFNKIIRIEKKIIIPVMDVEKSGPRVVKIKKGKKSEILKEIEASSNV